MKQKQAVSTQVALRYQKARKKEKGIILSEFVKTTSYNRSYSARVLRQKTKVKVVKQIKTRGFNIVVYEDGRRKKRKQKRIKAQKYNGLVFNELKKIWIICDCICGKRLAPFLPTIVPVLEKFGEITVSQEMKDKLLNISPATIDRMLKSVKRNYQLKKGFSTTKPGTLLKKKIQVRTFTDWDDLKPGFFEVDLVAHCGEVNAGEYILSLNFTDVCSGWVEPEVVMGKSQFRVFERIKKIEENLAFPILGIDSDNDSSFINAHLLKYCEENSITFTRCRAYQKNDQCHVEQKNYSIVRRALGYNRYDTDRELKIIRELYQNLRLYVNFFQPVMKLKEKIRNGAKVTKKYGLAKTPYQRILDSKYISQEVKRKLKAQYDKLNPAQLKRNINGLQEKLMKFAALKEKLRRIKMQEKQLEFNKNFRYIFNESTKHRFKYFFK